MLKSIIGDLFSFLEKYSEELETRFLNHRELLSRIQNIIPAKCAELDEKTFDKTIHVFEKEWPNDVTETYEELKSDMKMWKR